MFPLLKGRFRRHPQGSRAKVVISLNKAKPIARVDERYLSFSIDISVLAGGQWWDGSAGSKKGLGTEKTTPLSLKKGKLDKFTRALAPAYLRVGGSEADNIHYFTAPQGESGALVLTQGMWDDLHRFCARNDLALAFTFKYGLFKRRLHGRWQADEVSKLLAYSSERGQPIAVCELGNELNAYWAFYGLGSQPMASKLAADYDTFIRTVRHLSPHSKVAGPGSAFWPRIGEAIKPITNITPTFLSVLKEPLDIVDWHYYPFQSRRSPVRTRSATLSNVMSPQALKDFDKYLGQLKGWRNLHQPNAVLWTGETGSAQCGGEARLSDRFASSFWWADQLGRGARAGQAVMVRQSLVGGDYGLINRQTLKANPDFWVSWLWQKLMGREVFEVQSSDESVLAYCHSARKGGKCTLLLINMAATAKAVECRGFGMQKKRFELTADKLTDAKVRINGVKPKFQGGKVKLKDFPSLARQEQLKPYSINFWCFLL
ncbi:hypothetical protein [Gallaecimonas pentaromativorans]|uniref:hypothetical protein n=1 Tax=Gallaecimonas pentaromativorans TaxID=584787 RepID=UPI003A947BBF